MGIDTRTIALMPIAIALNVAIGWLVGLLQLPIYLDSIGTILVGVLAGPLAGALTGLLSNLAWWLLTGSTAGWFTLVAVVIGVLAGFFGSRAWIRKLPTTILAGLVTGFAAGTVASLILAFLLGGISGGGTDAITAFYLNLTGSVPLAAWLQSITIDPIDKILSYLLVFAILKNLPRHLLVRFPQGDKVAPARRRPLIGRVD